MADLNSICLTGRLTKQAEMRSGTNTPLCTFSIAVGTGWGDNAKTSFFDVNFWGRGASGLCPYLIKGKQVAVSGIIEQQNWVDKQTGMQRSRYVINTNQVALMSGDPKGSASAPPPSDEPPIPEDYTF